MLSKASLFMVIAFAVGMCEMPEYQRYGLVGEYTYGKEAYQVVAADYETKSGGGSAFMLFESGESDFDVKNAKAICLDTNIEACRIKFGQQLRADGAAARDEGGMGY